MYPLFWRNWRMCSETIQEFESDFDKLVFDLSSIERDSLFENKQYKQKNTSFQDLYRMEDWRVCWYLYPILVRIRYTVYSLHPKWNRQMSWLKKDDEQYQQGICESSYRIDNLFITSFIWSHYSQSDSSYDSLYCFHKCEIVHHRLECLFLFVECSIYNSLILSILRFLSSISSTSKSNNRFFLLSDIV